MEEVSILPEKGETFDAPNFEPIKIQQNEINYILNIEINEDKITFSINDKEQFPSINYVRKISLKEIKELNKVFYVINSFNDFYDYLKSLSNNNKLNIKKTQDKITLIFYVEVLLKQEIIEIDLYSTKKDINLSVEEIYQELLNMKNKIKEIDNLNIDNNNLKNDNNNLTIKINDIINEMNIIKNENKTLNNEINTLKLNNNKINNEISNLKIENNEIKLKIEEQNKELNILKQKLYPFMNKSVIMRDDEKDIIIKEIENKINKRIKEIKKLYQATIDGGEPINFHSKCDNIPNTLVLIKSEGNRRFGGFTPIPWKSEEKEIFLKDQDNKTFVFSLDNKKIYYLKDNYDAVCHYKERGPIFGRGPDIGIFGNPLKEKTLHTYQCSFDYKGDKQSLSEYQSYNIKALEYEVFQVICY